MARMDMSYDGPSSLVQHGHEAARGLLGEPRPCAIRTTTQATSAGPVVGPPAGSVACTVPAAVPAARARITQLPHIWSPPGDRRTARRA
jgi:hypothetical protein